MTTLLEPLLRSSEVLAGLSEADCLRLEPLAETREVRAGVTIFELGDEADRLFIVGKGTVDLTLPLRVMGEVKEVKLQALTVGRALAWSALVPPHRMTMSARAGSDVELVALAKTGLFGTFSEEPRIGLAIMTNLARVAGSRLLEIQALWVRELQRNLARRYGW